MPFFYLDTESYSTIRIENGLDQYMTGADNLITTFCGETGPVKVWDRLSGERMPNEFEDNLLDERVTKVAHNAQFDHNLINVSPGIETPVDQWWCTMAQAYAHGLPGSLEALGPVVGIPNDMQKMAEGKKLIQLFCVPYKGKPRDRDWETLIKL